MCRIRIQCKCRAVLDVKESLCGSKIRCPKCKQILLVPAREAEIEQSNEVAGQARLKNLTPRQLDIYNYIAEKITLNNMPPTVREIGNAFDIKSPNGVTCHLKALEKKGVITRDSHSSRAIHLVYPSKVSSSSPPAKQLNASVLSPRQLDVFNFISDFIEENKFSPTVREIGCRFGIASPNGVVSHLKALEKKGFVVRSDGISRGLKILGKLNPLASQASSSVPARNSRLTTKEPLVKSEEQDRKSTVNDPLLDLLEDA